MPYPQWTDPQMVYGQELNDIVSQTISRFETAADRATAIKVPKEGQVTWVKGLGYEEFSSGGEWVTHSVGPRLIGGKRYPGTDNLVLMPDHAADDETYTNMSSGPVTMIGGRRYAIDAMICARTTIDNDVLRLTIREDDGDTHLTGLIVGFYLTWPLKATTDYIFPLTFDRDAAEDMDRTFVVTAERIAGSGEIWIRRRDLTTELASPHVSVREVGKASLMIAG